MLDPEGPGRARVRGGPAASAVSRPSWSPDGRSLLVLGAQAGSSSYAAEGRRSSAVGRAGNRFTARRGIDSAVWVGKGPHRASCSPRAGPARRTCACSPAARTAGFRQVKDFPALTGSELAATGHHLVLRRGGAMELLDVDRAAHRVRGLGDGANPGAWAG